MDRYQLLAIDYSGKMEISGPVTRLADQTVYPLRFRGLDISVVVTPSAAVAAEWLSDTLHLRRKHLRRLVVGVGVRWNPGSEGPAHLLQLCIGNRCLVFQLTRAETFPVPLRFFLLENDNAFVAFESELYQEALLGSHLVRIPRIIELDRGYCDFTGALTEVPTNNWDAETLTDAQVIASTLDSFAPFLKGLYESIWEDYQYKSNPTYEKMDEIERKYETIPDLVRKRFKDEHPTIGLCLQVLLDCLLGGETVLIYGRPAEGVIGRASIQLYARVAVGTDDNGNELLGQGLVQRYSPPGELVPRRGEYDIVTAILPLGRILSSAEEIVSFAKPGGLIVLSGFTSEQGPLVSRRFFDLLAKYASTRDEGMWSSVFGRKPNPYNEGGM